MKTNEIQGLTARIAQNIGKVIVGAEDSVELLLCAMVARGHVLMEDVPGTGKTKLAKSLARSVDCPFNRIQFTPDLLPGDVTGMSVYDARSGEFVFKPGPVFTGILLADEINRATPRTQSALLECMEERQVTTDGVTRALAEPFMVIATQNPVETQGTFPLPEAQLDRFLMKLALGYPTADNAVRILSRFIASDPLTEITPCASAEDIRAAQIACQNARVSEVVLSYIARLCEQTRKMQNVALGVSPRGMLALMRACQALSLIRGRDFVTPDDVKALAVPVLAHRVIVRGAYGQAASGENVVREAMNETDAPTENA